MTIFSPILFPEDVGRDIINQVELGGRIVDIFGNPVLTEVEVGLNKQATGYKDDFQLSGDSEIVSSEMDGSWTILVPDSFNMTADSYYRIIINDMIYRKSLPDFPSENTLNRLEDY